jgi:hypothetical protein
VINLPDKSKKSKKSPDRHLKKIITGNTISADVQTSVREFTLYDVLVMWTPKKILNELTGWGTMISLMIKK